MSASGSCRTSCLGSLYGDLLRKISLSGCLRQDPVGSLVQDLCMGISCARCLRSPQRNPVEALNRCRRFSCARCLRQDLLRGATCARSLYADLLCISIFVRCLRSPQPNPVEALAQDRCMRISCACLCVRISASGSCIATCARSLYADLLCKISLSGCLQQDPVGPLAQDLCMRISCAYLCVVFKISAESCRSTCARSVYEDLLRKMSASRPPL